MPIYEFKCDDCRVILEKESSMKDAPTELVCIGCKKVLKRYYGSMNFICKGDGWPSKSIRAGKSPVGNKRPGPNPKAKKIEDVMNERQKAGMNPGREKPMSDAEFERRKKLNKDWIDGKS
jgi:putative FmdB family regulatory protein